LVERRNVPLREVIEKELGRDRIPGGGVKGRA
jgi:hypothetical protein